MPIRMQNNRLHIVCDCNTLEHQIVFDYDDDEYYLMVHLSKKSFFRRFIHAIKYIIGYQSQNGAFDEVLIGTSDLDRIIEHMKKYKNKDQHVTNTRN